MRKSVMKKFLILITLPLLVGCSTLKKFTGQSNDTILPGAREDILAPDQQQARDPIVTGQAPRPCDPNKTKCPPATIQ
jgi:hypothetical protein